MAHKKSTYSSVFWLILNLAVGAMLAVGGIWALQGGGDFAADALKGLFSGDARKIVLIVFGVIELLSGIFIIIQFFIGDRTGSFGSALKVIIVVVWAIAIVIADFLNGHFLAPNFLAWIYTLAMHLIVLGALLITRD
ncbi:MAG: hypothetical protein IJP61_07990 [Treponema sp.]|nr:hypothetical protein [Treponema sp.]